MRKIETRDMLLTLFKAAVPARAGWGPHSHSLALTVAHWLQHWLLVVGIQRKGQGATVFCDAVWQSRKETGICTFAVSLYPTMYYLCDLEKVTNPHPPPCRPNELISNIGLLFNLHYLSEDFVDWHPVRPLPDAWHNPLGSLSPFTLSFSYIKGWPTFSKILQALWAKR